MLSEDIADPGHQLLSDEDIIEQVTAQDHQVDSDDDDNDECLDEPDSAPRSGEVADMLDKCLLWYEQQQKSTPASALLLKQIRDLAAAKRYANLKQMRLKSFISTGISVCYCIIIS